MTHRWVVAALLVGITTPWFAGHAQISSADFDRALKLQSKYSALVINQPETPVWQESSDTFVYRKSVEGGHEFVLVDATTQTKQPAFDHEKLAAALSTASGQTYKATTLPFPRFRFGADRATIEFVVDGVRWRCDLHAWTCASPGALHPGDDEYDGDDDYDETPRAINDPQKTKASPDGTWLAFVENYNVRVRSKDGKQTIALSEDGSEDNYYAFNSIVWSPDSTFLAAYRIRPGYRRLVHYVESSPATQLQPRYSSMVYPKPGDVLALPQPVLFDLAEKRETLIDNDLFPNPFDLSPIAWWKDSRGFTFEYNQRGHQLYRVIDVDAHSGRSARHDYGGEQDICRLPPSRGRPNLMPARNSGTTWPTARRLSGPRSAMDGTPLSIQRATGQIENQITKGSWVVRAVNHVDEEKHQIWFEASGMNAG